MKKKLLFILLIITYLQSIAQVDTCFNPTLQVLHGTVYSTSTSGFAYGDMLHLAANFNGANYIGTNTYNVSSIPYVYYTPTGSTARITGTDLWSNSISIPFNFNFFGCTYNNLRIGENGIVSFDQYLTASSPCPNILSSTAPNTAYPKACIMGAFQDLSASTTNILTHTIGSAPCRKFIITYDRVNYFASTCTPANTSRTQIVLYEGSNFIDIHITDQNPCSGTNAGRAIVGIQDYSQTVAYTAPGENNTAFTATNQAWRFNPSDTTGIISKVVLFNGTSRVDSITPFYAPYAIYRANFDYLMNARTASLRAVLYVTMPFTGFCNGDTLTGIGFSSATSAEAATNTMNFNVCDLSASVSTLDAYVYCDGTEILGEADANAFTSNGPCTYLWSTGSASSYIEELGGYYSVTVTDDIGCEVSDGNDIYEYDDFIVGSLNSVTHTTCGLNNGEFSVTFNNDLGGTSNYDVTLYDALGTVVGLYFITSGSPLVVTGLAPDNYTVIVQDFSCDLSYPIEILPSTGPVLTELNYILCTGESVTIAGHTYNTDGYYEDTISVGSCDSVILTIIDVLPSSTFDQNINLCAGSSYHIAGHIYTTAGLKHDTLSNVYGCDSIINTTIAILPASTITQTINLCTGSSYSINGHTYNSSGLYRDTFTSSNGCDSIINTNLIVTSSFNYDMYVNICPGSSYNFNGTIYNSSGLYHDTVSSVLGCDSIINLHLNVNNIDNTYDTLDICIGQSILGITPTSDTTLSLHYSNINTCDSIYHVEVIVHALPIINLGTDTSIFLGDSIRLGVIQSYNYNWNTGATSATIIVSPISSTIYSVIVTDSLGCINTDTIVVNIISPLLRLAIPNAFTPNGDGLNDIFYPILVEGQIMEEMTIFNSYGETVFTSNSNQGWDGRFKGEMQPISTYVYSIKVKQRASSTEPYTSTTYTGALSLVR